MLWLCRHISSHVIRISLLVRWMHAEQKHEPKNLWIFMKVRAKGGWCPNMTDVLIIHSFRLFLHLGSFCSIIKSTVDNRTPVQQRKQFGCLLQNNNFRTIYTLIYIFPKHKIGIFKIVLISPKFNGNGNVKAIRFYRLYFFTFFLKWF